MKTQCKGKCCHDKQNCGALFRMAEIGFGFICTLPKRHSGHHIACGSGDLHDLKIWKRNKK